MPPCLILSNIRYAWRVKWSNPGKGAAPFSTPQCSSYRKGSLLVALDYGRQFTNLSWVYYNSLKRYERVMSLCSKRRRGRIISSLQDFLYPSFHSPIWAFNVRSLLCGVLYHLNCHLFWVKFFISIFKSVYGSLKLLSMGIFQVVLAVESALSFPLIPPWLGMQHSFISLVFDRNSSRLSIFGVRGLSRLCFFRDVSTD